MTSDDTVSLPLASLLDGDRVVVTNNLNQMLEEVDAPERLAALAEVLGGLSDGWTSPAEGVPVGKVRLNFYADGAPHGNLSIGKGFLAAHVQGGFLARDSDVSTARLLLRALGVGQLVSRL